MVTFPVNRPLKFSSPSTSTSDRTEYVFPVSRESERTITFQFPEERGRERATTAFPFSSIRAKDEEDTSKEKDKAFSGALLPPPMAITFPPSYVKFLSASESMPRPIPPAPTRRAVPPETVKTPLLSAPSSPRERAKT